MAEMDETALGRALQAHDGRVTVTIRISSQVTRGYAEREIIVWQVAPDDFQIITTLYESREEPKQETFRCRGQRGRDRRVEELGCPASSEEWLYTLLQ